MIVIRRIVVVKVNLGHDWRLRHALRRARNRTNVDDILCTLQDQLVRFRDTTYF